MSKPLGFGLLEFKTFHHSDGLKSTIKTNNKNKNKKTKAESGGTGKVQYRTRIVGFTEHLV